MKPMTIVYTTSRHEPKIEWVFYSLAKQLQGESDIRIIAVDTFAGTPQEFHPIKEDRNIQVSRAFESALRSKTKSPNQLKHVQPKPTIWQGKHRITKTDWWAKSNALNTGICLCQTEWIAFVDDRCVLAPTWLQSIREAMDGNYAVCGSYEKRANMKVENGEIIDAGELLGADTRTDPGHPYPFDSWYGGSGALPLEWCLQVQGFPESVDGAGTEDSMFGVLLRNNHLPVKYDPRMKIIEDRTPGQIDGALKRADKNPHLGQQAKSWAIVRMFKDKLTSQNPFDIRNMRDRVLNGEPFPPPTGNHFDWYDQQLIAEME